MKRVPVSYEIHFVRGHLEVISGQGQVYTLA